ncbi:putative legumain protein [Helianthus annuus]|nr:putative legumain protein [Helianthus annuus]KAJ0801020.1 putative legumain protein [Helianthus annuus]
MMWTHDINDEGMISAVLFAGCKYGYDDYTLQADICHVYRALKKGHVKEDNVVVMMSDDITSHSLNREHGVIRHELDGTDVYHGVHMDYFGKF